MKWYGIKTITYSPFHKHFSTQAMVKITLILFAKLEALVLVYTQLNV